MSKISPNKAKIREFKTLLNKYIAKGKKPTRALEMALEDYNNSRKEKDGISIATAWRWYKKIKGSILDE